MTFAIVHGHSSRRGISPVYRTWAAMLTRCRNPRSKVFKYYGGRGIKVCERWLKFENFLADMGDRPAGLTLDRKNNDGNYEPKNCHWATRGEQNANRRKTNFCKRGHMLDESNTYIKPDGHRNCRICMNLRAKTPQARERHRQQMRRWRADKDAITKGGATTKGTL